MSTDEIRKLASDFADRGKMAFGEAATSEQISEFEKEHNISLPTHFKEWLRFSDGGEFFLPGGVQFYGVSHKPLIDIADDDRPNENYIVIGALATGDPILFEIGKESISIYNHTDGKIEDDEIYADFFAFLSDLDGILGIGG